MKIIKTDQITLVTPSSEYSSSYLATNVQNNYRGLYWMGATAATASLVIDISANSNALMLSNMNSGTVTVEVQNAGASTIYGPTTHTINQYNPNLWINYTLESGIAHAYCTFATPTSGKPYCGIARAGYAYNFRSVVPGLSEGLKDTSVSKELNNGAEYYYLRSMLRTFSGSFLVDRDSDFYTFMHTIVRTYGRGPYAMFLTDLTNFDWAIFGWLDAGLPSGSHAYPDQSTVNISIVEGL